MHDHEELVVKPAAPAVMAAGLYAGTTLADDGSPILLLDPSGIAKRAGITLRRERASTRRCTPPEEEAETERETSLLLFRTLDGGRRAVPVTVVERIEDVPAEAIRFGAGKLRVVDRRAHPAAGRLRRRAGRGQAAHPAAHRRQDRDRLRLRRGDRHPLGPARPARRAGAGRGGRRRPDRRCPGRDARSPLAVRRAWRSASRTIGAAGLRAARRRSLDGQRCCVRWSKASATGSSPPRGRRRRHRHPLRGERGRKPGRGRQVVRLALAAGDRRQRRQHLSLRPRRLDRRAEPRRGERRAPWLSCSSSPASPAAASPFPPSKVEAVVELEGITPAPCAAPHVAGLSALRSRVLTVIDGLAALESRPLGRGGGARRDRRPVRRPHLCVDRRGGRGRDRGRRRRSLRSPRRSAPAGTGSRSARSRPRASSSLLVDPHLLIAGPRGAVPPDLLSDDYHLPLACTGPAVTERNDMRSCLVVDDSKVIRKVARHILETLDFSVDEAEDGREALTRCEARHARRHPARLEHAGDERDGVPARASPDRFRAQPKVVFCTTENDIAHIRAAIDAGADEYVMKPFDRDTLTVKLQIVGVA